MPAQIALPAAMPGHWDTEEGRAKAIEYASLSRAELTKGGLSDLALANAQFLASRDDIDLIVWQTASKERIRSLSAQLAMQRRLVELPADVVDQLLRAVVREFPEGGPGHERAIRLAINLGWQARHTAGGLP